jgi:hypothetical protein
MFVILAVILLLYGTTSMILKPNSDEEGDIVKKVKKDKVKEIIE